MTQTSKRSRAVRRGRGDDLVSLLSANFFKALADPNRLAILTGLAVGGGHQSVSEVAARVPVDMSVVSRHLKTLRDAGILEAERRGKEVLYRARVNHLVTVLRQLADAIEVCCPDGVCTIVDDAKDERKRA